MLKPVVICSEDIHVRNQRYIVSCASLYFKICFLFCATTYEECNVDNEVKG